MDVKSINDEIYNTWVKHPGYRNNLAPEFIKSIQTNSLLFVGLNPAFKISWIGRILRDNNHAVSDPEKFFQWDTSDVEDAYIKRLMNIELDKPSKLYPYFRKFEMIADSLRENWNHIDLFYCRETNQNKFRDRILNENKLNSFGKAQFQISCKVIRLSQPKVIVFCNALGSSIFKGNYRLGDFESLNFDSNKGYHLLKFDRMLIPTFFTGMLTGQRALDLGSLERLQWHIKQAL